MTQADPSITSSYIHDFLPFFHPQSDRIGLLETDAFETISEKQIFFSLTWFSQVFYSNTNTE